MGPRSFSTSGKTTITINTKSVEGRRQIRYANYQKVVDDAKRLAGGEYRTLGNWSFSQILQHIALASNATIDGFSFRGPLPLRIMAQLFMKNKFLKQGLPAGFSIPVSGKSMIPEDLTVEEALNNLRSAVKRLQTETQRAPHPVLKLTDTEKDEFQLRHAELHMSFVLPVD